MKRRRKQRIDTAPRDAARRLNRTRATTYCDANDFWDGPYVGGSQALRLPTADEQARGKRDDDD